MQLLTEKIVFLDGRGSFHEEQIAAEHMTKLNEKIEGIAMKLEKKWGCPVNWRKMQPVEDTRISLKIKINVVFEKEFIAFLEREQFYFKTYTYGSLGVIWNVDVPKEYDLAKLKSLTYLLQLEEMPIVVLD